MKIRRIIVIVGLIIFLVNCSNNPVTEKSVKKIEPVTENVVTKVDSVLLDKKRELVYFAFDSSLISDGQKKNIKEKVVDYLTQNSGNNVVVEGHTDSRGSLSYNKNLGNRRAESISQYLKSNGINKERITIISYGEEKPAINLTTFAAWKKNRRVEIVY